MIGHSDILERRTETPIGEAGRRKLMVQGSSGKQRLAAAGGMLGAVGASACCVVPLILFSLGIQGAWIGQLTALAPYKPIFLTATAGILGYGFYLAYWKQTNTCAAGAACAWPVSNRLVKPALWSAAALGLAAFAFDYLAPVLLGA